MKAIVYDNYGTPDVLSLQEIDKPSPKENEVLVKIHAASINSWDWDLLRGEPFIVRVAGGGLSRPIKKILGCDVAGTIEAVGKNIKRLQIGDKVFGDLSADGWGGFAEYVCTNENTLTLKPDSITFEQAASLPQAAVMALQGIRDYGKVKPKQKVLINGAGGGVGSFAIQMAKMYGAEVTGVDSEQKFSLMTERGADHVIDYNVNDFTKNGVQYDFILDVVGHHSIFDYKRSLKKGGIYRMVGGNTGLIFQSLFLAPFISMMSNKKMGILAHEPNKGLDTLLEYIKEGNLVTNIDRSFLLEDTAKAFKYFGEGNVKGKVVITMA